MTVEAFAPEAVRRSEHDVGNAEFTCAVSDDPGTVYVGSPKEILIIDGVRQHGGAMEDGIEPVLIVDPVHQCFVADITLDRGEIFMSVIVLLKIDVHDAHALIEQLPLENSSEKTGPAGYKYVVHPQAIIAGAGSFYANRVGPDLQLRRFVCEVCGGQGKGGPPRTGPIWPITYNEVSCTSNSLNARSISTRAKPRNGSKLSTRSWSRQDP